MPTSPNRITSFCLVNIVFSISPLTIEDERGCAKIQIVDIRRCQSRCGTGAATGQRVPAQVSGGERRAAPATPVASSPLHSARRVSATGCQRGAARLGSPLLGGLPACGDGQLDAHPGDP
jgi:hypothetical protein